MSETPPNRKSVMPRTGTPRARATSEWASSCASTDPKNNRAATIAVSHASHVVQPGWTCNNTVARSHEINRNMNSQLQSIRLVMLKIRPSLKPPIMLPPAFLRLSLLYVQPSKIDLILKRYEDSIGSLPNAIYHP